MPGQPEPSSSTFKILLVDAAAADYEDFADAFKDTGNQIEVIKFFLGETLFTYLQEIEPASYPNIIVLDHVSGTLSAFDILQQLKSDPKYARIPVLIHSTILSAELKEELLKEGAEELREKESMLDALKQYVQQLRDTEESFFMLHMKLPCLPHLLNYY